MPYLAIEDLYVAEIVDDDEIQAYNVSFHGVIGAYPGTGSTLLP